MRRLRHHGFSLVEVVIAIGIVAGAVAVILRLLPTIARETADSADAQTAIRMAGSVESQLQSEAATGLGGLAGLIPVMQSDPDVGRHYVADRDGVDLRIDPAGNDGKGQYFLVVVRRYQSGALAYDGQGAFLAVNVVISWPYRLPTASGLTAATGASDRRNVTFNVALNP